MTLSAGSWDDPEHPCQGRRLNKSIFNRKIIITLAIISPAMSEYNFDPIRPYYAEELKDALHRIVRDDNFKHLLNYLFPGELHEELTQKILAAENTHEFQLGFMLPVIRSILDNTAGKVTVSGIERVEEGKGCVYIANHRDIILDSSILALHLVNHGFKTCQITWGDNLMISPFIVDVGKANRMVTVFREGSPKEIFKNSQLLSAYIRESVVEKGQGTWIAQRKGRSKDGTDSTDVGVLKMLSMTGSRNVIESLQELNITPVSISYEWEPCDAMKVRELMLSEDAAYVKGEDEDLNSIIGGVVSKKGNIHVSIGKPINEELDTIDSSQRPNDILHSIAQVVDRQIHEGYKLWPSNLLAHNMLNGQRDTHEEFDEETVRFFNKRMDAALQIDPSKKEKLRELFLKLYANPVNNKKGTG
jgi:hypothetical protein